MRGPVLSMTCQPGACGVAWLTRSTRGRTTSSPLIRSRPSDEANPPRFRGSSLDGPRVVHRDRLIGGGFGDNGRSHWTVSDTHTSGHHQSVVPRNHESKTSNGLFAHYMFCTNTKSQTPRGVLSVFMLPHGGDRKGSSVTAVKAGDLPVSKSIWWSGTYLV